MSGNYNAQEREKHWQDKWVEEKTYSYDKQDQDKPVFTIDTPPPTVSGKLHMGHLYGQTLQDFMARFQRMRGKKVYQPFGYDDNGIASERLTERELNIKHQDYTRREFQQKCREVCRDYEDEFTQKIQRLGISIDWDNTYKTIEPRVQKISQLSFIDLYEKDREYREKSPAIWCPDCETAISQVEMEDKQEHSTFNDIRFDLVNENNSIKISTTRPELLPACVSIFVHPDDEENQDLVGKKAEVPLFDQEVPIIEDERVDMEKGSGLVMCCTFGDQTDIEWYKAHDLPLKIAINENGTMTEKAGKYEGMTTEEAREEIINDLDEEGYLLDQEQIQHTVQAHERCEETIEFRVAKQWYIKLLDKKDEYLQIGKELEWYPDKMFTRYKNWVEGLQWDWCISRQRDSGIPFPVWYCTSCDQEIIADEEQLPVDPIEDTPPVTECPECGNTEFEAEEDVFDTWATSSLTPLINSDWNKEKIQNEELYPMNLRPEGHDIITFWLFHTLVKCYEHTGEVPFNEVMNHGHILDENKEKMSKSKGNVVYPEEVMEDYPIDTIRYWAASSKVGDDFPFKEKELVAGERFINKIWNASKFCFMNLEDYNNEKPEELETFDKWILQKIENNIEEITENFENYEFNKAKRKATNMFWDLFCDNYLEIVKDRIYNPEERGKQAQQSAKYALYNSLLKIIKVFAPLTPHITEELYTKYYKENNDEDSIHLTEWPEKEHSFQEETKETGNLGKEIIQKVRKYKSEKGMSLKEDISKITVDGNIENLEEKLEMIKGDLKGVTHAEEITTEGTTSIESEELSISIGITE